MNKLKKYIYAQNGYKSDKPITYPKLSKLEIDKINQANQKRLFEENQAQLSAKTTPTTQAVKNIGKKIDRDKRINLKQDKANLLGIALSSVPVIGEIYNAGNTVANTIVDLTQGEYEDALLSAGDLGLSKIFNKNVKNKLVNNSLGSYFSNERVENLLNPFYYKKANKALEEANQWSKKWYNHPETLKRFENMDNPFEYPKSSIIKDNILKKQYESKFESIKNKAFNVLTLEKPLHWGNNGISGTNLDIALPSNKRFNFVDRFLNPDKIKSTSIHEGNHGITDGNNLLSQLYKNNLQEPFDLTDVYPRLEDGSYKNNKSYLLDPTEINARIQEIRHENNIKPGQIVDDEILDKILDKVSKGTSKVDREFFINMSDFRKFKDALNILPAAGVVGTGVMNQANNKQTGGMNKLLKYCQTGIKISPSKKGTFTAQATKMGMGVQEAASTILNAPEGKYSPEMRRKANFAFNSKSWKHQIGGYVENEIYDLPEEKIQNLINQGYKIEYVS